MLDEAVRKAMERWPNVPDVFGWLRLDRRGQWLIKDETIANVTVRDFISRNYLRTDGGAYAFQNGPQRVFVELDYAPWVVSLQPSGELRLHTGATCGVPKAAWMDEAGALLLEIDDTAALLDDRDLDAFSDWLVALDGSQLDEVRAEAAVDALAEGRDADVALRINGVTLPLKRVNATDVATQFNFVATPQEPA